MSHLVKSMAWTNEVPWHNLGFEVSNDLTAPQMMQAAKVDWTVSKQPAFFEMDGKKYDTGKSALIRDTDRKVLDVVSHNWNPTQNETAFEFFREYVDAGQMSMETAGSLDGGRQVWALAKINTEFEAVRGDVVKGYLLFSNPHRFGRAITVRFTPIRVVCNNTLTYALELSGKDGMSVSVNHSKKFDATEVKKTLAIATSTMDQYKEAAQFLATKKYTTESVTEYVNRLFPKAKYERKSDRVAANDDISRPAAMVIAGLDKQPGAELANGTWWNAVNAITYYTDHHAGRSADSRLNSAWFGLNQGKKLRALNLAVEYAQAA